MLEKESIPAIAIVTDAFENTAREMAQLWGVPDFQFVSMPHPLANMTPAAIERASARLMDKVIGLLVRGQRDAGSHEPNEGGAPSDDRR
jgi:hypothetical protein